MPQWHGRAIDDIIGCRTGISGTAIIVPIRSPPTTPAITDTEQTERWLEARKLEMMPCHYFHITLTVPHMLRDVLRAN
jgi:hypothetical protein